MGQYYRPIIKANNRIEILNRNLIIDGQEEYTSAKITEHSWVGNWFMEAVCDKIYNSDKPVRLIWMGDYANQFECYFKDNFNGLTKTQIYNYHRAAWREPDRSKAIDRVAFNFMDKYIINHTKKEYVDCSLYYKSSVMKCYDEEWCLHPLSLLTCIGNGLGGGDYIAHTDASTFDLVGSWAWDEINITDEIPQDYDLIQPIFKEKGWEETEE